MTEENTRKRRSSSEIDECCRKVDELLAQGVGITAACEQVGINDTLYRKRKKAETGLAPSTKKAEHVRHLDIVLEPPAPQAPAGMFGSPDWVADLLVALARRLK